jgi:hypothetical protein
VISRLGVNLSGFLGRRGIVSLTMETHCVTVGAIHRARASFRSAETPLEVGLTGRLHQSALSEDNFFTAMRAGWRRCRLRGGGLCFFLRRYCVGGQTATLSCDPPGSRQFDRHRGCGHSIHFWPRYFELNFPQDKK